MTLGDTDERVTALQKVLAPADAPTAAFLAAIILGSTWQLDEPRETDVMQAVADNKQAVQTDKLVLAGQP